MSRDRGQWRLARLGGSSADGWAGEALRAVRRLGLWEGLVSEAFVAALAFRAFVIVNVGAVAAVVMAALAASDLVNFLTVIGAGDACRPDDHLAASADEADFGCAFGAGFLLGRGGFFRRGLLGRSFLHCNFLLGCHSVDSP